MGYIIEMCGITKEFPGIVANDDITLRLKKGEIHALLGENGAGKSTLMSVLFGLYQAEKGEIKKNGETVNIHGPNDATRLGIGMVHQHFMLVHNFTVLQNIMLGMETTKHGLLNMEEAKKRVLALSKKYKLEINPDAIISDITVGMQQRVEILKMLYRENEILIFDEPTAVLTPQEIEELMKTMKNLVLEGKSILFITHKLDEIMRAADRCTVLRKGKHIDTVVVSETSKAQLSQMMVGRKVSLELNKPQINLGDTVLRVDGVTVKNPYTDKYMVQDVSFDVRSGEIVCVAGIDGNGQSELIYALTGLMPLEKGGIYLKDKDITKQTIRQRSKSGIAHIPEDRHKHGLLLDFSLAYNLVLQKYYTDGFCRKGFLRFDAINEYAKALIEKFDIRCSAGGYTLARSMSGGNQQKAIIAREVDRNHQLLIAVQPTRGLDVGAIEYIHSQLISEREKGKAVLLVSLELDEVMNISDRILVMFEGKIVANVNPREVTFQDLGLYMSGSKKGRAV